MTPSEILQKHEDANEMHFHEVDRKFIIEAMEEYAKECHNSSNICDKEKSEKPINLTAVEWLVEQMFKQGYFDGNKPLSITNLDHLEYQAKQMEKEQSITDYKHGQNNGYMYRDGNGELIQAEQYYNETYNSKQ